MEDSLVENEARRTEQVKKDDLGRKMVYPKPILTRKLNGRWTYQCEKCGCILPTKRIFHRHMENHNQDEPNDDDAQEDNEEVQETVVPTPVRRKKPSSFSCFFCSKCFWNNSDLEDHTRIHINEKPFGCPHPNCEKIFTSDKGVQKHLPSHSNKKPYKCSKCGKRYKSASALTEHKKLKHLKRNSSQQHKCQTCPAVFDKEKHLNLHLQTHMNPLDRPSFQCLECKLKFTWNNHLRRHMKHHHNKEKPIHKCLYCRRIFLSEDDLREHKQKEGHDRQKEFGCAICNVNYPSLSNLKRHLKTDRHCVTKEDHRAAKKLEKVQQLQQVLDEQNYVLVPNISCKSCKSTFPSEQDLAQHVNNVHNVSPEEVERPFCCKVPGCNKAFKTKQHLKIHVNAVHLNLRNYPCSRCGKAFNYNRHLKRHNVRNPDCDVVIRDEQSKHFVK